MQEISKKQMDFIKKHSPTTNFKVTNRQSSGKHKTHYVEETDVVKKLLRQFSEEIEIVKESYGKV